MHLCLFGVFFLLLRRPPRSTPTAHSFPTRRSSDLVWPGSIWRDSTTPPTGERIAAFRRLVSSDESWARACATLATAESTLALARASAATAASISVLAGTLPPDSRRSEEHTSELQSLMRISYAVFCLKKKKTNIILQKHD